MRLTIDSDYMKMALDLAQRAKGQTSPNPIVGAVIVRNNKIIAEGYHRRCGADHAEVVALKKAGKSAKGAKLYVTLEPCSHFGRTPPCVDRIIQSGIEEVNVGMIDPNPVNNGKSILKLKHARIKTKVGFLKEELQKANESFIKFIRYRIPFVVVKSAQTIDGKIATALGQSKWITSKQSRNYAHHLRNDFDAILVGIGTVLKDNPRLNATKKSKRIKKIILDTTLRIPLQAQLFKNTIPSDIIVATTEKMKKDKYLLLKKKGVDTIICPPSYDGVDLSWLLKKLAQKEITNILVEGGSKIIGSLLKENLVDKFLIFIAPKIMGDERAINSVRGLTLNNINRLVRLKNLTFQKIGDDILIEGYVYRNH